jgi:hypothetical protein
MTDQEKQEISLHVAGATVRHSNPFDNVVVFKNSVDIDQEFIDRFLIPYYMDIPIRQSDKKGIEKFGKIKDDFTKDVVKKLLGDFNWRTRQTGAYFAAINDFREFEENIGQLLLKSEVCYAGTIYALALGTFNTKSGQAFLTKYLDYYLTTFDLFFDQKEVLTTVKYLDEINGTNNCDKYLEAWDKFIENKPNWKRDITTDNFKREIEVIVAIKKYAR